MVFIAPMQVDILAGHDIKLSAYIYIYIIIYYIHISRSIHRCGYHTMFFLGGIVPLPRR